MVLSLIKKTVQWHTDAHFITFANRSTCMYTIACPNTHTDTRGYQLVMPNFMIVLIARVCLGIKIQD